MATPPGSQGSPGGCTLEPRRRGVQEAWLRGHLRGRDHAPDFDFIREAVSLLWVFLGRPTLFHGTVSLLLIMAKQDVLKFSGCQREMSEMSDVG